MDQTSDRAALERLAGNPAALVAALLELGTNGRVYQPGVDRSGDKIIVPEGANLPDVISALDRQHRREQQQMRIRTVIPASPWDGALGLIKAIQEHLGVVIQQEGMRGAQQIDVEVDLGKMDSTFEDGRIVFVCHVSCKRRYESRVRLVLDAARTLAVTESLHRGKAFSIVFRDSDGDRIPMPMPKFFQFVPDEPIFTSALEHRIERNVFVPLRHTAALLAMGESLKRGILFSGGYGVGKTLLASYIARVAVANGWTFIYVKDSEELPDALRYAQQYQPVVVFAEDVDRVAGAERTDEVNDLLNQLDGIDGKVARIMTILTTNHADAIHVAMMRPGRIDAVVEVQPPDAETVARIIRKFAGSALENDADLSSVSHVLAGQTPAKVREVIGRARLELLRRAGGASDRISAHDLETVGREVVAEGALIKPATTEQHPGVHAIAAGFEDAAAAMRRSMNGSSTAGHA